MKQTCAVPAFLSKLWTLIEDHSTNDLICWSQDGTSFLVLDEVAFSKEVLPLYFKHSNMTSFVRQLNMYGFHKVIHIDTGLPSQGGHPHSVEFRHVHFRRSQAYLLGFIRRKVSMSRVDEASGRLPQALLQVSQVKSWCDSSNARLLSLCRDNETLWKEIDCLRQKHQQLHQVIRKIVCFIANTVQANRIQGLKRKLPMIDSMGEIPPAAKYRRCGNAQSEQSHTQLDSASGDGLYSNRMILSDITQLMQPRLRVQKSMSMEGLPAVLTELLTSETPVEFPFSSADVPTVSDQAQGASEAFLPVILDIPSMSADVPSLSPEHLSAEHPASHLLVKTEQQEPSQQRETPSGQKPRTVTFPSEQSHTHSQVDSVDPRYSNSAFLSDVSRLLLPQANLSRSPSLESLPAVLTEILSTAALSEMSASTDIPSEDIQPAGCPPMDLPFVADMPPISPGALSESDEIPSVDLALSLLMEPEAQEPSENSAERYDLDPLTLIDSSLAAISSGLPASDSLDLLSELLCPMDSQPDNRNTKAATPQRKPGAQRGFEEQSHKLTAANTGPMMCEPEICADEEDEEDEDVTSSDILPSLLQLAQEASALSCTSDIRRGHR
ncbi:heat shock factor protein-like [Denticeps clupeoides]|uniref:HSF-type DNA-binding domain-containing protein n=1 Tax=Denticeps clupeoides TaxID=299321 RepID=A0AAY4EHS0_9TELE|nr:heat shock factor protein 5 [Denticeps clupeoides]